MSSNKTRLGIGLLAASTALALCACGGDNGMTPAQQGNTTTLSALVHSIFAKDTSETAKPRDLNGLKIDTTSQDPNDYSDLLSAAGN